MNIIEKPWDSDNSRPSYGRITFRRPTTDMARIDRYRHCKSPPLHIVSIASLLAVPHLLICTTSVYLLPEKNDRDETVFMIRSHKHSFMNPPRMSRASKSPRSLFASSLNFYYVLIHYCPLLRYSRASPAGSHAAAAYERNVPRSSPAAVYEPNRTYRVGYSIVHCTCVATSRIERTTTGMAIRARHEITIVV